MSRPARYGGLNRVRLVEQRLKVAVLRLQAFCAKQGIPVIEAQAHERKHALARVVSDDYLKAPFSTLERNAALWQAASGRPGFVLLVAVKPSKLPTLSDHIRRCELFGVPEDAARLRFRDFMTARAAPEAVAFPGKVFAVSNIPIRVPETFVKLRSPPNADLACFPVVIAAVGQQRFDAAERLRQSVDLVRCSGILLTFSFAVRPYKSALHWTGT
jgi:hypothetical protein